VPVPPPGHKWKAVIHNQYVSWLAGWKDSINTKDWKCVPAPRGCFARVRFADVCGVPTHQVRAARRDELD
jgi:hypothetical protein